MINIVLTIASIFMAKTFFLGVFDPQRDRVIFHAVWMCLKRVTHRIGRPLPSSTHQPAILNPTLAQHS